MSSNPTLLKYAGTDLCGTCHESIRDAAAAETGHPPAAEDCISCHAPHASPNRLLLMEATPDLCLMCHDADDSVLVSSHLGASLSSLDCLSCHSPHGAGNEHLLATNVHAAILDGCDTCHEGAYNELMEDGESPLCLACHDDIGEAAEAATVPHPALEMARCADCHNPHASPQEKLVSQPAGGECTVCHEDQAAAEDEVAHGVIALIGCRACHEPHGGENENLLRLTGSELCLECHSSSKLRRAAGQATISLFDRFEVPVSLIRATALELSAGETMDHPIKGHRVLGEPTEEELEYTDASFSEEFTCLTCHDPHKGASKLLFRDGARSPFEVCASCHKK
jgi:predicted CXXCH cytochrome family protein